ncbi:MAG: hypothetical protein PGN16_05480 [Sphingomonas phyllosphaerae]|uniref:hypothetical protein n=1 Tax=Sphingomonas phyllosphaerae TaxID=257003 RepID=UPI002FF9B42A
MAHRSEPQYRPLDTELDGVAGCLVFVFFLILESAGAGIAAFAGYLLVRNGQIDVGHEIGIGVSIIGGIAGLLWIDRHCRRLTGYSAGEIASEFLFLWW